MANQSPKNPKGVLVDLSKCVGCGSCTVACKMWNNMTFTNPQTGAVENAHGKDVQLDSNTWTTIEHHQVEKDGKMVQRYVKRQCMHCQDPGCLSVCFSHAFHITKEGAVQYDPELCVGCRYCMLACPFDIPKYEWEKVMPSIMKCQFCSSKIADGESPACVSVCPTDALVFGDREDLLAQAKKMIADDPRYVNYVYGEHEAGGTNWLYISDVDFGQLGFPINLPKQSVPSNVKSFTRYTPAIFIGGAALWSGISLYSKRRHHIAEEKAHETNKEQE